MKLVLQINWVWFIIYVVPTFIQPIISRYFRSPMFLSDYMVPFRFTWLVSFPPHPGRYCEYKDTFSDSFQYFLNPFVKIPFAIVYYRISERVVSSQVVQDSLDQKHGTEEDSHGRDDRSDGRGQRLVAARVGHVQRIVLAVRVEVEGRVAIALEGDPLEIVPRNEPHQIRGIVPAIQIVQSGLPVVDIVLVDDLVRIG